MLSHFPFTGDGDPSLRILRISHSFCSQITVTNVYGWTAVAIVILTILYVFGRSFFDLTVSLFTGVYQVSSKIIFSIGHVTFSRPIPHITSRPTISFDLYTA